MPSLLLLLACSQYTLDLTKDAALGADDTAALPPADTAVDTATDTAAEVCPGLDPGVAEPVVGTCFTRADPTPGAFVMEEQWYWPGSANGAIGGVAVGHVVDDDGDGVVGPDERPEVVVGMADGTIRVLGADGAELSSFPGGNLNTTVVLADVDGDGFSEIVTLGITKQLRVNRADGTLVWASRLSIDADDNGGFTTACDLDGDGTTELVGASMVVNAEDGSLAFDFAGTVGAPTATCADLDGDGAPELLYGAQVFEGDGTPRFEPADWGELGLTNWANPLAVQADADPEGEVVVAFGGGFLVSDTDGIELLRVAMEGFVPGMPCAGDFDGDGAMELGVIPDAWVGVDEMDGTPLWAGARVSPPNTQAGGCTAWDMDADGAHEMVAVNGGALLVFAGETGEVRYDSGDIGLWGWVVQPVVSDLDADGSAEILVASGYPSGFFGVWAFTQPDALWPAGASVWPNSDFSGDNATADGRFPVSQPWLTGRVARGIPLASADGPDLGVRILDTCFESCSLGYAEVTVQAENHGTAEAPAGATVELYTRYDAAEQLVATWVLPAIPAGQRLVGERVQVPVERLGNAGFVARVDAAGAIDECNDTDNEANSADVGCL